MVAKFIDVNEVVMTFLGGFIFLKDGDNPYLFKFKIGRRTQFINFLMLISR